MGKSKTDKVIDVLVFGQIFVDELEEFEGENIFRREIKFWSKKVIKEFRSKVDLVFKDIPKDKRPDVSLLYEINHNIINKINTLSLEEKQILSENFDILVKEPIKTVEYEES
jgi:hypothetical protein